MTSRKLQDPKLDLNAAVAMVVSQKRFVEAKRETFTEYERHGATHSFIANLFPKLSHNNDIQYWKR